MEISAPLPSNNPGITLIEVLISMVIFSVALGLSSQFIATGMQYSHIRDPVEPWLTFMSQTEEKIRTLSEDSDLWKEGEHSAPFPELNVPTNLQDWSLQWEENSLGQSNALFKATRKDGRKIQWRVFR